MATRESPIQIAQQVIDLLQQLRALEQARRATLSQWDHQQLTRTNQAEQLLVAKITEVTGGNNAWYSSVPASMKDELKKLARDVRCQARVNWRIADRMLHAFDPLFGNDTLLQEGTPPAIQSGTFLDLIV